MALKSLAALGRRPVLLWEAVNTAWAFRSKAGLSPARSLLQWRKATAYGTAEVPIDTEDLISFLMWRRDLRKYLAGAA